MTIKVQINNITKEQYQDIILFWNYNKILGMGNLELLNSKNGGFQTYSLDENFKIKFKTLHQLHWYSKYLVSYVTCPGFSEEEEYLLYKSLCYSLGKENVLFYDSFSSAFMSSPKINYTHDLHKSPSIPKAFSSYIYRTHIKI